MQSPVHNTTKHAAVKPTADPSVAADKKGMPKYRQRIDVAMTALLNRNTFTELVRDLQAENKRLREENDQVRGIVNGYKKELEEFRAVFNDYRYSCVVPDLPKSSEDHAESVKMEEN